MGIEQKNEENDEGENEINVNLNKVLKRCCHGERNKTVESYRENFQCNKYLIQL